MTERQQTEEASAIDGRTLRRTRNRDAVIAALLSMIREGTLHPGAAEIADRAGVSHRSIFRYFDDLDDLVRTTINQAFVDAGPLTEVAEIGNGSLDERVGRFVDARICLYQSVDNPMQLARMRANSIPSIDEEFARFAKVFRDQISVHFMEELSTHPEADRQHLVDGVLILTSYDSYSIHVRLLDHDVDRIRNAWSTAVRSLMRS